MSTPAEKLSTTLSEERGSESSVDATDQIAELLVGGEQSEEEDNEGDESPTELSTLSEDESNEVSEAAEESEEELDSKSDDEQTWGSTLGIDEDSLSFDEDGNINGFVTKVNGEAEVLPLKDILAGYQNNKSNTIKSQEYSAMVKEFNVQKEQVEQAYFSKLESVDALSKHFEKQLISEYDNVDWNQLRAEDPAEYAAARSDFAEKATELQRIQEAINMDKEANMAEVKQRTTAAQQQYLKQNFETMIEKNPEWADEKVRNIAKDEFKTFVTETYGFNDKEFETVYDARLIELIKLSLIHI